MLQRVFIYCQQYGEQPLQAALKLCILHDLSAKKKKKLWAAQSCIWLTWIFSSEGDDEPRGLPTTATKAGSHGINLFSRQALLSGTRDGENNPEPQGVCSGLFTAQLRVIQIQGRCCAQQTFTGVNLATELSQISDSATMAAFAKAKALYQLASEAQPWARWELER